MSSNAKQTLKVFTYFLMVASAVGCASAARHGMPLSSAMLYGSIKTFVDSSGARTVVLVPMRHVGKPAHYQKVGDYLDTLKSHGYVTFCEGLLPSDKSTDTLDIPLCRDIRDLYYPVDSMKMDTLSRKLRKILGVDPAYLYDNIAARWHSVKQDESFLHLYGDRDYWVDGTYADMIKEFEMYFGEIELSPYDFECPLGSDKYKGKEDKRWKLRANANTYCNVRLVRCILESGFEKIAVVYGYSHIHRLYWFALPNNGYIPVENPYYQ